MKLAGNRGKMSADNVVQDLLSQGLPARQVATHLHTYLLEQDDRVTLAWCMRYVERFLERTLRAGAKAAQPEAE